MSSALIIKGCNLDGNHFKNLIERDNNVSGIAKYEHR
jgi:hypothetical protein